MFITRLFLVSKKKKREEKKWRDDHRPRKRGQTPPQKDVGLMLIIRILSQQQKRPFKIKKLE